MKKQNGFSAIEILVLIAFVGIIGLIGWLVMRTSSGIKITEPGNKTVNSQQSAQIPSDWQWYENKEDGVKFAYPKSWGNLSESTSYSDNKPIVSMTIDNASNYKSGFYASNEWIVWHPTERKMYLAEDKDTSDLPGDPPSKLVETRPVISQDKIYSTNDYYSTGIEIHSKDPNKPVYVELGKGEENCGSQFIIFPSGEKIVTLEAFLCSRGGQFTAESQGAFYEDAVYKPLDSGFYKYIQI